MKADAMQTETLLLTPKQAACSLNVSEKTLYLLTRRGELPAVRSGRMVRYEVADLRAWIAVRKIPVVGAPLALSA
jgi:excisionase family DNA binding protein